MRAVELQLLLQRAAHGLDDVAVDLVLEAVRIDDLPAIVGDVELACTRISPVERFTSTSATAAT